MTRLCPLGRWEVERHVQARGKQCGREEEQEEAFISRTQTQGTHAVSPYNPYNQSYTRLVGINEGFVVTKYEKPLTSGARQHVNEAWGLFRDPTPWLVRCACFSISVLPAPYHLPFACTTVTKWKQ